MPNEPDPLAEDLKAVERFEAAREASAKAFRSGSADQKDRTYDVSVSRAEMNKRACERFPALVRELQDARAAVAQAKRSGAESAWAKAVALLRGLSDAKHVVSDGTRQTAANLADYLDLASVEPEG